MVKNKLKAFVSWIATTGDMNTTNHHDCKMDLVGGSEEKDQLCI